MKANEFTTLNEDWSDDKKQRIKDFAIWAIKILKIEQAPKIRLVKDSGTTALGYFDPATKEIVVTFKDRHQMDIMRTLAHELVHRKQLETKPELDGATGSVDENEANALAGVLLRYWGKSHPEHFREDLEENFADGKKPGRKGLAKRSGVNCKQPVNTLRKIAKNSSGERQRMAHWCANMKSGKNK
jgi:hypothetical protein